jgi:hypothetical protein
MASPERYTQWRYLILDDCFHQAALDPSIRWFKEALLQEVNRRLTEMNPSIKPIAMRTLEKDLVDFEGLYGTEVLRQREGGKVYYRYASPEESIHQGNLSKEERIALMTVLESLGRYRDMQLWDWWAWAEVLLRGQLGIFPEADSNASAMDKIQRATLSKDAQRWLLSVAESLFSRRPLRIAYAPGMGEQTERISFLPEHLVLQENRLFALGRCWDPEAEDWFGLCLDLNEVVALDDVAVDWPESRAARKDVDFSWSQYIGHRIRLRPGLVQMKHQKPEMVRVWVEAELARQFLKEPMHPSQDWRVEQSAAGIIFTLQVVPDESFKQFAWQWGRNFQVLEPAELRHAMREESKALADMYAPMFGP